MSRGGAGHKTRQGEPETRVVLREVETVERLVYTRSQAAEALGISLATLARRVLPYVDTVVMPEGATMIPVDELERLVAEGRRPSPASRPPRPGRHTRVSSQTRARILHERGSGSSLAKIAEGLNRDQTPTAQGGAKWWPSTVRAILDRSQEYPRV